MIIKTIPVIFPIVKALGYDPISVRVIITMRIEIVLVRAPDGTLLYVLQGMRPDRGPIGVPARSSRCTGSRSSC